MKTGAGFNLLDAFDLTEMESEVYFYLARNGRVSSTRLAQQLDADLQDINQALDSLSEKKKIRHLGDGHAEAIIGQVKAHTTLPAQLWELLLPANRHFSEIDIAALRAAVPILKFARARLSEFTDHGPSHALRVKSFARQLGYVIQLSDLEHEFLATAALFHDVGNVVDRERHHIISQETVVKLTKSGELPFTTEEAEVVGLICRWHRKEYDSSRCDILEDKSIRTGLLASILRVADAMDIDHRRSDHSERFSRVLALFFPGGMHHWTSLEEILGVRIRCTPNLQFQVLIEGLAQENIQIAMLRNDLKSTPLEWSIQEIAVHDELSQQLQRTTLDQMTVRRRALLVFPFEPNSLIMAALSRKHLEIAGYEVELLSYPDIPDGSSWLWGEMLEPDSWKHVDQLVVIGDRPDTTATDLLLSQVSKWLAEEKAVSLLNRHEANWSRIPALLELGVDVVLGGDWTYFWGDHVDSSDLTWARIAALATRDPTQSTLPPTGDEQTIIRGLMRLVYAADPTEDTTSWIALAETILDRIQNDDRAYFVAQSEGFAAAYERFSQPGKIHGRVIWFQESATGVRSAYPWALESAIEQHGRALVRGICFNIPYAIVTWADGDAVELLAINHWLEEEAVPIRLHYPADLGLMPVGNESIIQVRLPKDQAESVIEALLCACNQGEG